ncbi:MAG: RNA polymerase sigma factor [Myxococcota bacterium]|nr:RNA polymerase sigma factor [Myxococcota bacterium]
MPPRELSDGVRLLPYVTTPAIGGGTRASSAAASLCGGDVTGTPRTPSNEGLSDLYRAWFDQVVRWLRALGAPKADLEDLAQEVFLVTRRRLEEFDGRNTAGWLYRIASGQLRQHRRRSWVRALSRHRDASELDELPTARASALSEVETAQRVQLLLQLLSHMSEKRRVVFLLFDVLGHDGGEISNILDVPINTVKTRLHHARKDFSRLLAEHRAIHPADL